MKKQVTGDTRQRILKYIYNFFGERGYAPTVRDILKGCDLSSTAVVQHHLNILEQEGHIHRDPEVFRSIQLTNKKNSVMVPVLGTIAAGSPIPLPNSDTWEIETLEILELNDELVTGKDVYALKVKGLSMIDALIDDGDTVLMQPVSTVKEGDMVAAWIKDKQEVTLKRFYREPDRIRLEPANSQMEPIYVNPENVEIHGKVVGVIRKL